MTQTRYNHLINSHRGLGAATLRDIIIPALLGTETEGILYWIGKDLAREYPVATEEELIVLTNQLGMGELSLKKRSATQQIWELGGPIVDERLVAEAEVQERGRHTATFLVQNDPQDNSDSERTELVEFIHPQMPTTEEPTSKKRTGLFGRKKKK